MISFEIPTVGFLEFSASPSLNLSASRFVDFCRFFFPFFFPAKAKSPSLPAPEGQSPDPRLLFGPRSWSSCTHTFIPEKPCIAEISFVSHLRRYQARCRLAFSLPRFSRLDPSAFTWLVFQRRVAFPQDFCLLVFSIVPPHAFCTFCDSRARPVSCPPSQSRAGWIWCVHHGFPRLPSRLTSSIFESLLDCLGCPDFWTSPTPFHLSCFFFFFPQICRTSHRYRGVFFFTPIPSFTLGVSGPSLLDDTPLPVFFKPFFFSLPWEDFLPIFPPGQDL